MATERTAKVTWSGSLMEGAGRIEGVGSGAFGPLDVTWAARAEEPAGKTSPEELIAAAWASCFSMALSHALAGAKRWAAANRGKRVLVGLSGRGDKDMPILAQYPVAERHHAAA